MISKSIYKIYKKIENNPYMVTLVHFIYGEVLPRITGKYKPAKYNSNRIDRQEYKVIKHDDIKDYKVAIICDDMTYENYKQICNVCFLTPNNWIRVMSNMQPDLFLCESAWRGISQYEDCWRGKIYKNKNIKYENRKVLFQILDYCKRKGIKSAFWNKEDPLYFDDEYHNFSDTALHFDYIFTTAGECVEKYKKRGHEKVFVSGFGFSPDLYDYDDSIKKEDKAVFAGSWYSNLPNRCKDMEKIFDTLIERNVKIEIYDRYYESPNPIHQYPDKYKPYIRKAVPYSELKKVYSGAKYAININTEQNSNTMFARRVFEIMACKCIVISNRSIGMENVFGENVWFIDKEFDFTRIEEIVEKNYSYVMRNCTNYARFVEILENMDLR